MGLRTFQAIDEDQVLARLVPKRAHCNLRVEHAMNNWFQHSAGNRPAVSSVSRTPMIERLQQVHRWDGECSDEQFLQLVTALRAHGGLLPMNQVRALCHVSNPGFSVSEALISKDIFMLTWRHEGWAPWFQFTGPRFQPCPSVTRVTKELRPAIEGVNLALWFVEPSAWLFGETPLSLLYTDTERVRQVARLDRFAVDG